ncbi:MAG: protein-L-isoaspartate O-methyltransferase [Deltaproteobacteria bacterium SG8_13]|nr:MAG: protein-L-isoaspartate O-methyltransferase [Deltaproteobacteria bacterium SG8_13]
MMRSFPISLPVVIAVFAAAFASAQEADRHLAGRLEMVRGQIEDRGISDNRVLEAMRKVPRHLFVPENLRSRAYNDGPLPIGEGQTISQPYIVALMTQSLGLTPADSVLEIGTGSGYQAAVLAEVAGQVFTVEIKEALHHRSNRILHSRYPENVHTRLGDGYYGWQQQAPFDAIMITAAVDHIPPPLIGQLKEGGRLILPLGNPFSYQNLVLVTRQNDETTVKQITGVLFVPLTGFALTRGK